MLFKAKLRHLRISPRKVRLVTDLIKGLPVKQAQLQLKFLTKRAVDPILKLLNSAIANAESTGKGSKDNLVINNILVDPGPTLKRWRARAMGRAASIKKRTSHITLILEQKGITVPIEPEKKKEEKQKEEKQEIKPDKEKTLLEEISKDSDSVSNEIKKETREKERLEDKKLERKSRSLGNVKKIFRRKSF